ncbi:alpha-amylase-like [Saccostrea echinata]|uniref:alpha-amylase-like n=1 Tax=Saccostrea echinata TaxID=191078 RepID=UPI002A7F6F4B|nr:alpha-amylase-like [Saccostrea echinata]
MSSIKKSVLVSVIFALIKVAETITYQTQVCLRPGTDVIVQLFEWKWDDIAKECENFLGPKHFCAVQVSPPNENRIIVNSTHNRPWLERYEPVSYKIQTRSGNESQFRDMVRRCNNVQVSVYADIVINHMTDVNHHGYGTGNSVYHGEQRTYPTVPYGGWDFHDSLHCHTKDLNIETYSNPEEVRNCQLEGKADINHGRRFVQDSIVDFLNKLIDLGVSGFRISNAKYMWPEQLQTIFDRLKDIKSINGDLVRPFLYHEFDEKPGDAVQMSEYFSIGKVEYENYGVAMTSLIRNHSLKTFHTNWGTLHGMPSPSNIVTFIDDQVKQRDILQPVFTHTDRRMYEVLNVLMLAYPYGIPRLFSGYSFTKYVYIYTKM